ncbi:MAG TPA: DUF3500 domain-containing protein [Nocardioidaceae bacterium]|nr:DUF3500 domain-containing protein [Nocardioidaceae bacterium]
MRAEASAFLDSLYDGQREVATYDRTDPERRRWQYTPGARGGLALQDMNPAQRDRAMALVDAGLSTRGARTARAIMDLEPVLKALEERQGRPGSERRDPQHYWFAVFGDPHASQWGWRVGGHHLSLHFTMVGERASVTPLFFGANPARVPDGPHEGQRVLAAEEDLARELLASLDPARRARAVVSDDAPRDILTGNAVRAQITAVPTGVDYASLDAGSQTALRRLVDHYRGRVTEPPPVDLERVTFAWAGSTGPGKGHYYAVRTDTFLLEYDNTQNDANHVHTVWRDLARDWGDDLLAGHYRAEH